MIIEWVRVWASRTDRRAHLRAEIDRLDERAEGCFAEGRYSELDTLLAERKALFGEYQRTFGGALGTDVVPGKEAAGE